MPGQRIEIIKKIELTYDKKVDLPQPASPRRRMVTVARLSIYIYVSMYPQVEDKTGELLFQSLIDASPLSTIFKGSSLIIVLGGMTS
jgi:hypothetical protein